MSNKTLWEELEVRVRTLGSYIWNAPANSEEVHGVRCDAVIKLNPDRWILLEITKINSLEKLRTDLAKFAVLKPALQAEGIHSTCYFVTLNESKASLIQSAKPQGVTVLSVNQLEKMFFDYEQYHFVRNSKPFGSAVDISSGEKDTLPYVPVTYNEVGRTRTYTLQELADVLCNKKRIILLGNYGTGKSRCVQEVFAKLGEQVDERHFYPLAIDLRDHWGLRRGTEIIRRHFDDLGFSKGTDSALRVIDTGAIALLLDGFDEIASQVWSDDPKKLEEIRVQSLMGVADLIRSSQGGVLVVGREHYFNSNDEMFRCLGLEPKKTLIVSCAEEFSNEQMEKYLDAVRPNLRIPNWLPRRPLVSKMVASFNDDELTNLSNDGGEVDFWDRLLSSICKRESRIHPSLDPSTIRSILLKVANLSREKINDLGPISLKELNDSFESVVGDPLGMRRRRCFNVFRFLVVLTQAIAIGSLLTPTF